MHRHDPAVDRGRRQARPIAGVLGTPRPGRAPAAAGGSTRGTRVRATRGLDRCRPPAPFWPDAVAAGDAVAAASVAWLARSGATRLYADGALPAPGVYGLPEQWPHVHGVLERAGFAPGPRTEIVFLTAVDELARAATPVAASSPSGHSALTGPASRRCSTGGHSGTSRSRAESATMDGVVRQQGWADIVNLEIDEPHRRRGIATWLLGRAAEWLLLGHTDRLLADAGRRRMG